MLRIVPTHFTCKDRKARQLDGHRTGRERHIELDLETVRRDVARLDFKASAIGAKRDEGLHADARGPLGIGAESGPSLLLGGVFSPFGLKPNVRALHAPDS